MRPVATTTAIIETTRLLSRAQAQSESLSKVEMFCCWTVSIGISLWVATNWVNQRWVLGIFQLIAFVAAATVLRHTSVKARDRNLQMAIAAIFLIPLLGVLQMLSGRTAYLYATLLASLDWMTFACMVCIGVSLLAEQGRRIYFFRTMMVLSTTVTAMELYQLFALGRYTVLSSGIPLLSSNGYAELTELILPPMLFVAIRRISGWWFASVLSALMIATVIASGARAGSLLVIVELLLFLGLSLRRRDLGKQLQINQVAVIAIVSILLVLVEGAGVLKVRLSESHPFEHRQENVATAFQMIAKNPLSGVGLGCFSVVYPQFQRYDSSYFINHVHNDYLEIATDGGVIMLTFWIVFLVLSFTSGVASPWGIGCFAILIHSLTDFPMYRPQVAALFALMIAGVAESKVQGEKRWYISPVEKRLVYAGKKVHEKCQRTKSKRSAETY